MARRKRRKKNDKHIVRDYVVFFICAFVLIFLTSSFVIENVYNNAGNIAITPEGVKEIYLSATGQLDFNEVSGAQAETTEKQDDSSDQETTEQQTEQ